MGKLRKRTLDIIETVLKTDPGVTELQRDQVKAILTGDRVPVEPKVLKQKEAAKWLSVSKSTMYNLVKNGTLTPVVIGDGVKRYRVSDLEKICGIEPDQKEK